MSALFRSYSRYGETRIGEIHRVLVCEQASDKIHYVGHNKSYEQILVPGDDASILGHFVDVKIVEVSKYHMKSCLIKKNSNTVMKFFSNIVTNFYRNYHPIATALFSVFVFLFLYFNPLF